MQYRPQQKSLFENVFLQKFSKTITQMWFFSFRTFNVHEVLSMLEDDGTFEQADIFIEPPEFEADTDAPKETMPSQRLQMKFMHSLEYYWCLATALLLGVISTGPMIRMSTTKPSLPPWQEIALMK
jgi:hypothetical protein